MKTLRITAIAAFLIVLGIFISAPSKYMQSFFDGITVWAYNVLPAIFPFTVLTTLALKVRPKAKISFSKKLFCIDCDSVFIASLLCGYPIGAKIIGDSDASTITATKACAFCSSAGPIFMIGTVGAKLLQKHHCNGYIDYGAFLIAYNKRIYISQTEKRRQYPICTIAQAVRSRRRNNRFGFIGNIRRRTYRYILYAVRYDKKFFADRYSRQSCGLFRNRHI